ncbi:TPA: hypothetical protein I7142_19970 [Vibrio vulnificus]|nr:hypothetical protein [Vibrio vulnificus]HAS6036119.1 hypothetical protein [Vibrio vulnificus]
MFQSILVNKSNLTTMACDVRPNNEPSATAYVMEKSGHYVAAPFGGSICTKDSTGLKRVKIMFIHALCTDPNGKEISYIVPEGHYVVGIYSGDRVFILVEQGRVQHEIYRLKSGVKDNVVYISQRK